MTRKLLLSNIGVCVLFAVGVTYVALVLIRFDPLNRPYPVTVELERTGGIYFNSDVTYRGHPIGDVTSIRPVDGRVQVTVEINPAVEIPRDTKVVVGALSPVGEQYLDFQPNSDSGPYLTAGDTISQSQTEVPGEFSTMMGHVAAFADQIDPASMETILDELAIGLGDPGNDMGRLVRDADEVTGAFEETLPETLQLLRSGRTVLDTGSDLRPELLRFADDAHELTDKIRDGHATYRKVLRGVSPRLDEVLAFVNDIELQLISSWRLALPLVTILADRGPGVTALIHETPIATQTFATVIKGGWIDGIAVVAYGGTLCPYNTPTIPPPWIRSEPAILNKGQHCKAYAPNLQQRGSYYAPRPSQ